MENKFSIYERERENERGKEGGDFSIQSKNNTFVESTFITRTLYAYSLSP